MQSFALLVGESHQLLDFRLSVLEVAVLLGDDLSRELQLFLEFCEFWEGVGREELVALAHGVQAELAVHSLSVPLA